MTTTICTVKQLPLIPKDHKLTELETYIMSRADNQLSVEDVLYSLWPDTLPLVMQLKEIKTTEYETQEQRKLLTREQKEDRRALSSQLRSLGYERRKLKSIIEPRKHRVSLAFNQLFLSGLVKIYYVKDGTSETWDEMKARAVDYWDQRATSFREMIVEAKTKGADIRWLSLYMGDAEIRKDECQQSEILRKSQLPDYLKDAYKPEGEYLCVGVLHEYSYPARVIKAVTV